MNRITLLVPAATILVLTSVTGFRSTPELKAVVTVTVTIVDTVNSKMTLLRSDCREITVHLKESKESFKPGDVLKVAVDPLGSLIAIEKVTDSEFSCYVKVEIEAVEAADARNGKLTVKRVGQQVPEQFEVSVKGADDNDWQLYDRYKTKQTQVWLQLTFDPNLQMPRFALTGFEKKK